MRIEVREARESDYPAIARIQGRSSQAAQWPVGDYSGFALLIAFADSLPAGFCAWRQSSPEEAEVLNLATDPAFRRRGIAAALLQVLGERAHGELFLEVSESNEAAISLYEKHGWRRMGIRKGYYENGRKDGIVMRRGKW